VLRETTVDLTVRKEWVDENEDARPASLPMVLTGGGRTWMVTLTAANNWTATVRGIPAYRDGEPVKYTWTEAAIPGYQQTSVVTTNRTTVFTNTRIPEEDDTEYTLTIYYRYQNGNTAAETHYSVHQAGDAYDVVSPVIEGYRATILEVEGVMPARNMEYTVIYIPNDLEILDDLETPLGVGQVFVNLGDCVE